MIPLLYADAQTMLIAQETTKDKDDLARRDSSPSPQNDPPRPPTGR